MSDSPDDPVLTAREREALDAWTPLAPPADFAARVLAARDLPPARVPAPRPRWPIVAAGLATALAATVTGVVLLREPADLTASGGLVANRRTTEHVGSRAVAVAEPTAALTWNVDAAGAAQVVQERGDVFYRVDKGSGPFIVHTPAGDVRVTGTCFRIVIQPPEESMTKTKQLLLSGTLGAAVATAVVVTVYEGHVIAETKTAKTELAAGTQATLDGPSGTVVASSDPGTAGKGPVIAGGPQIVRRVPGASIDMATASREQLAAYAAQQNAELDRLRTRVAELEHKGPGMASDESEDGRPWHDPSPETLKQWAKDCRVQADEPGYDRWEPQTSLGKNERGLEPGELAAYNEALAEVQKEWKAFVRALYVETTGDTAGADTLSIDAMRNEILQKSADGEGDVLQQLSAERAGLTPARTDAKSSPAERLMREYTRLGDKTEAAIAKRLGAERASAIRGDGWGSRSRMQGCPGGE